MKNLSFRDRPEPRLRRTVPSFPVTLRTSVAVLRRLDPTLEPRLSSTRRERLSLPSSRLSLRRPTSSMRELLLP